MQDVSSLLGRLMRRRSPWAAAVVTDGRVETCGAGADPESMFEIGSVSKGITGCLYVDAVDRGEVRPDMHLAELLPVRGAAGAVTLESLSRHASGLPRLPASAEPWRRTWQWLKDGSNPYGDSLADLLDQVAEQEVGPTTPAYSNLGFQLLGHAVAAAAGTSYAELLRTRLVEPLALGSMRVLASVDDLEDGFLLGTDRLGRMQQPWTGEALGPAGGIRADATAMGGFVAALLDGSAPGLGALDPVADLAGPSMRIGAGWVTSPGRDGPITWHNGTTGGFCTIVALDRAASRGVVVMSARRRSLDGIGLRAISALT